MLLEVPRFPTRLTPAPLLCRYVPGDVVAVVSVVPPPCTDPGVQLPVPRPRLPHILGVELVDKEE